MWAPIVALVWLWILAGVSLSLSVNTHDRDPVKIIKTFGEFTLALVALSALVAVAGAIIVVIPYLLLGDYGVLGAIVLCFSAMLYGMIHEETQDHKKSIMYFALLVITVAPPVIVLAMA